MMALRFSKLLLFSLFLAAIIFTWQMFLAIASREAKSLKLSAPSFHTPHTPPLASSNPGRCVFGTFLISKCFCEAGVSGDNCDVGEPLPCAEMLDQAEKLQCFFTPMFGSASVDESTWRTALSREGHEWQLSPPTRHGDRPLEHVEGFRGYKVLPHGAQLGAHAEFGAGPWSQTLTSLVASRPDLRFTSITLSDPNVLLYASTMPTCSYRNGTLIPGIPTYLVNAGAEAPLFFEAFDSVMMINVLEHVRNAYEVLHSLWASLKPGGLIFFEDRYNDNFNFGAHEEDYGGHLDNILHPIRLKRPLFEFFFGHFEILFYNDAPTADMLKRGSGEQAVYLVGRKI